MKQRAKMKARARKKAVPPRKRSVVKAPAKTTTPDPLDDFIVAGTHALGLKVEKSWMSAVRANLRVTLDQTAMVAAFPLPDDAEPAPVFRA